MENVSSSTIPKYSSKILEIILRKLSYHPYRQVLITCYIETADTDLNRLCHCKIEAITIRSGTVINTILGLQIRIACQYGHKTDIDTDEKHSLSTMKIV